MLDYRHGILYIMMLNVRPLAMWVNFCGYPTLLDALCCFPKLVVIKNQHSETPNPALPATAGLHTCIERKVQLHTAVLNGRFISNSGISWNKFCSKFEGTASLAIGSCLSCVGVDSQFCELQHILHTKLLPKFSNISTTLTAV